RPGRWHRERLLRHASDAEGLLVYAWCSCLPPLPGCVAGRKTLAPRAFLRARRTPLVAPWVGPFTGVCVSLREVARWAWGRLALPTAESGRGHLGPRWTRFMLGHRCLLAQEVEHLAAEVLVALKEERVSRVAVKDGPRATSRLSCWRE